MAITASALQEMRIGQEMMFNDPASNREFKLYGNSIVKQLESQTVDATYLNQEGVDQDVKVYWIKKCSDTARSISKSGECGISEPELSTTSQSYTISSAIVDGFKIPTYDLRANNVSRDELVLKGVLQAKKNIANRINNLYLAYLNTNKDTPVTGKTGSGSISGGAITWAAAQWTPALVGQLSLVANYHKMDSPFVLNGENLYTQAYQNQYIWNGAPVNYNDMLNSMDMHFDIHGFANTSNTANSFMVNRDAVFFAHKNEYPTTPTRMDYRTAGTVTKYQEPLFFLPGVNVDVEYYTDCSSGKDVEVWSFILRYGMFTNPVDCNGLKGILKLSAV